MLRVDGWKSTSTGLQHMLFPLFTFPLICKSCNLSLGLTEPTSKPAKLQQPRLQSVFHLCVRTASFLVVNKSCYFKMIIFEKLCEDPSKFMNRSNGKNSAAPGSLFLHVFNQSVIYQALLQKEGPGCVIHMEVRVSAFQHSACFQH